MAEFLVCFSDESNVRTIVADDATSAVRMFVKDFEDEAREEGEDLPETCSYEVRVTSPNGLSVLHEFTT